MTNPTSNPKTYAEGDQCPLCRFSNLSYRGGHLQCNNCQWMAPSNTTSAAAEVAGAKEAGRFTGSYTADNDHSNSVAADGRSRAPAIEPKIAEARAAVSMWTNGRWKPQYAADRLAEIIRGLLASPRETAEQVKNERFTRAVENVIGMTHETKAEPMTPELLVLVLDWILNEEGWKPEHPEGFWNSKFDKMARAAKAEWDALQSPVKSDCKPSASTDAGASPSHASPPASVECPKCRTQLAFEGDTCGLCSEDES